MAAETPNPKPQARLVITDLDNTLYDWVSSFVPPLRAMIDVASGIVGVTPDELGTDLRTVHQRYGSSEHPFALLDAASVERAFPDLSAHERRERLRPAFTAFSDTRRTLLQLYDGVRETLEHLARRGIPVVAYTDARLQNALYRVARLGVVPLLARLYAPRHVVEPFRFEPQPEYAERISPDFIRMLPAEDRKPNPAALLDIARDFGVAPEEVVYVGDSLVRDVYMARQAGIHAAWARYGTCYDRTLWDALVTVTHWTDDDVVRESELRAQAASVRPDVELDAFSELLAHYDFVQPETARRGAGFHAR